MGKSHHVRSLRHRFCALYTIMVQIASRFFYHSKEYGGKGTHCKEVTLWKYVYTGIRVYINNQILSVRYFKFELKIIMNR